MPVLECNLNVVEEELARMSRTKKLAVGLALLVLVPVLAAPALGWEFEMTGSMNWAYEYYSQQGQNGFFGRYNVDNGNTPTTANLNYWWNGARLAQNIVTGEDASRSYFYVIMDPTVKINQAVKMRGRYRLGQWNVPQASYYFTQDAPGTDNALSEGQWTQFWATAQVPWGVLGIGKRPWKFGTGLQYDGSDGLSTESVLLNAPYGPLDIGIGFYPHRPAHKGATITVDPYDLVAPQYFNHADKSGGLIRDVLAYVMYYDGPLNMGILGAYGSYHVGPESQLIPAPNAETIHPIAQDSDYFHGTLFAKYNNGRFFFNGEAAWLYWTDRIQGWGAFDNLPSPRYTEQWRFMVETGIYSGPAKLSLIAAWTPGPDRRNGALIDRQSAAFVWHPTYDTFLGNYDVFRPYSFILSYNYGGGLNGYNLSLDGYMRDAWVLGGRLDYAAAANLNVYGTFMWAERTSHGYGWACIAPNAAVMPGQFALPPSGTTFPDGNIQIAINGAAGSPNIPDTALGWEANGGVDWQLLEGWSIGFLAGYWKPGKWFSYACIDRSVPAWNNTVPAATNFWGTRPNREIDPIIAGQFTMTFSF